MSYENDFVNAVERIEPNDSLRGRVLSLTKQTVKTRRRPVLKYAVSFVLVGLVFCGTIVLPWHTPKNPKNVTVSAANPLQQNLFTVTVNAAVQNGAVSEVPLVKNQIFTIQNTGSRCRWGGGGALKNGEYCYNCFYRFKLKCSGNKISKITYETNHGLFDQELVMSEEQRQKQHSEYGYLEKSGYENSVVTRSGKEFIYKPLGSTFTVDNNSDYDGIIVMKYTAKTEQRTDDERKLEGLFADDINQTKIKLGVTFSNGRAGEKIVKLKMSTSGEIEVSLTN